MEQVQALEQLSNAHVAYTYVHGHGRSNATKA